jgi:hypothetical protein
MFEDYTTNQLIELRRLCSDTVERTRDVAEAADALMVLEYIEEELMMRNQEKSA